ncbi:hypothetical protein LTR94_037935, partial [Friedmanniomyces endolithicus]
MPPRSNAAQQARARSALDLGELDQAGAGQAVVQELAVLVEEGGERPQDDAERQREGDLAPGVQAERGAHEQRRREPAPGQQVTRDG